LTVSLIVPVPKRSFAASNALSSMSTSLLLMT
jgi:hypothetical protein